MKNDQIVELIGYPISIDYYTTKTQIKCSLNHQEINFLAKGPKGVVNVNFIADAKKHELI